MLLRSTCRVISTVIMLTSLCASPVVLQAAQVDAAAARGVAAAFLEKFDARGVEIVRESEVAGDRRPVAYIFSLEPVGYVAVSADDALPPVVAYSLQSEYPSDAGTDNPLYRILVADLQNRLAALPMVDAAVAESWRNAWSELADGRAGDAAPGVADDAVDGGADNAVDGTTRRRESPRFQQWPPEGSTPTGGWLLGNWTQSPPYNALCPLDLAHGGTRSQAGCPAVAMAMILDYHRTVQETSFGTGDRYWHNYAGNAYWIPDAYMEYGFPSFTTLNGYLQTLTVHWGQGTPLTNTDKAALTFACGVAARQVYSAAVSGTFGVNQAFTAYQRFAFTGCRLVHDTDPELYPDMAAQMQNALPVHLAIVDPGWTMGHNVVVDGYNTDDYFHLNFGWGGPYNGWYLLPQEIPYGLTVVEGAILDIVPTSTAVAQSPMASAPFALAHYPNPFTPSIAGHITLSFNAPVGGHARLGIYDASGRLQEYLLDGEILAGAQSLVWNPDHLGRLGRLASGVYLARLEMGERVETRRLVLTR